MGAEREIKRRVVVSTFAISAVGFIFPSLATAAGPTLKPSREGQRIIWRGYQYIVVKSKGKLVWKQGAQVVEASATATAPSLASPAATATASATPSATPKATKTAEPFVPDDIRGVVMAKSSELADGQMKIFDALNENKQRVSYLLNRINGKIIALSATCTHQGCALDVEKKNLVCNCHISYFDPITGDVISGQARYPLATFKVTEADGKIFVK